MTLRANALIQKTCLPLPTQLALSSSYPLLTNVLLTLLMLSTH
jgi:hypothetical protein